MELVPEARIITSARGKQGLEQHYDEDWDYHLVDSGEEISIGDNTLTFPGHLPGRQGFAGQTCCGRGLPMATIGVGILGTGRISGVHVEALQGIDGAEVVAACSTTRERVESFASRYRIPHAFTDSSQLLVQPGLDAVVIATPNDTHAPLSIAALEAGKHVLCEKPMALNFAQARKMAAVSENTGRLLMIGMCRRFGEKVLALRRFVEQGDLGHVYYARAGYTRRWGNPGGWFSVSERSGGGPVIDLGVHVIDLVRYLLGGPRAVSVSASVFGGVVLPEDVRGVRKYACPGFGG